MGLLLSLLLIKRYYKKCTYLSNKSQVGLKIHWTNYGMFYLSRVRRGVSGMEGIRLSKLWKWTASFGLDLNLKWMVNHWECARLAFSRCSCLAILRGEMLSCGDVLVWGMPQDASFRPACPDCLRGLGELLPTPSSNPSFFLQMHTNPGLRRARSKVCLISRKASFREDS